jgi:ankyrin repeat protein
MKTPELHQLVIRGHADDLARRLFSRRDDIDAFDSAGKTVLMYAAEDPRPGIHILRLLLQHGATLDLKARGEFSARNTAVGFAVSGGDPQKVAMLVEAGASIYYCDAHGHDALLNAVHHRDIARDPRLLDLLKLLISYGVALNTVTKYQESALRVLSRVGRFDAVALLLQAGADFEQLNWTPLHRATALGTPKDLQQLLAAGHPCEERDWWQRTAWLIAILTGEIAKTQLLQDGGADTNVRGRCGATPLSFAVMGSHPRMLQWLIDNGQDVQQSDDYNATALFTASECDQIECAAVLLANGAHVDHYDHIPQTPLASTRTAGMTRLLLNAGADIRQLSRESRRGLLGYTSQPDFSALDSVSVEEFATGRNRRFGKSNPEVMDEPFWHAMIRSGVNGYMATQTFGGPSSFGNEPVWCADRFGQSITFLDDGRIVQIAGEHEDSYDPDFCIYNDVFVHEPDGRISIYGYPETVFPPTDFHTATLIAPHIYVIGSLGYYGTRAYGRTPVYRIHTETFAIEKWECAGAEPGWIHGHVAKVRAPNEIEITSGKIARSSDGAEEHTENDKTYVLDVEHKRWRMV